MPDKTSKAFPARRLVSRPQAVIDAEQKRHDRALVRGLTAFFSALLVGGGLAFLVVLTPLLQARAVLQDILVCLVFVAPLLASFIALVRVPPPPFEASGDINRENDKKQSQWRVGLLSQIFVFSLLGLESFWLQPRSAVASHWPFAVMLQAPLLLVVLLAVHVLYIRPGWLNPDLRLFLDDEVTRSFRARAQRLGYLLLLFILWGFSVLARINAQTAAHYMPFGLAAGSALPLLYFVYLDWQASRGG